MRWLVLLGVLSAACNDGGRISVDEDGGGDTDSDGGGSTGPNTAPTAPVVSISPAQPGGGDDLVASLVFPSEDADGDPLTYAYAWVVDGVPRADQTASTVPASATTRGEVWQVFVRADDGRDQGPPGDASVAIGNGAPTLSPSWATPTPSTDDPLVVDPGAVDPDGDPVTLAYAWSVDGALTGFVDTTVPADQTQVGQTWRVVITASDGQGGTGQAELSATIVNRLPVLSGLAVTPNPARLRDALVASFSASDPDGDAFETRYAWTVNGLPTAITGPVVASTNTHDGETWTVTVTLDDHHGTVVSGSASTSVVNHAPTLSAVVLTPAVPGNNDPLVASFTGSDADGDTLTSTVSWFRNGVPFSSGASRTLGAANTTPGETWTATVTVTDGAATTAPVTSNAVTIVDLPPTTPVVALDPSVPAGCGPLRCVLVGTPIDPDGTSVTTTVGWLKDGAAFTSTTTTTLAGDTIAEADLTPGATFTCRITAVSGPASVVGQASVTVPAGGVATETFTATARASADVLLVVDDSCSMQPPQATLAADVGVVLDELARGTVDYHLGVVTTDWHDPTWYDPSDPDPQGRLVQDAATGLRWITRATPDGLAVLQRLIAVGIDGSAIERGLDAAAVALSPTTTENAGFLRSSGAIGLLILSDEDDQGVLSSASLYATALRQLRAPGDLVTHGIVSPPDSDCNVYSQGERYQEFLLGTGGTISSICDASYASALEAFAGRITGLTRHFALSAPAPDGVASVVRISPGGARATLTQGTDWTFDAAHGEVELVATPASGTRFEVTYEPGCPVEPTDTGGDTF